MKAAQLFVKALENEGVEYIFGIPGEENIDVMDALLDSPIKFVTVHHEQGAAFMADVYGRLTGRAGVCLSTLGPGATNLITGVADANMDRAPVVAIAGQGATMVAVSPSCPIRAALAQLPHTCAGCLPCAPNVRRLKRCRPRMSSSGLTTPGAFTRPLS